jgi:hypothetical protein
MIDLKEISAMFQAWMNNTFSIPRYNTFFFKLEKKIIVPYCDNDVYNFEAMEIEEVKNFVKMNFPTYEFGVWCYQNSVDPNTLIFSVEYLVNWAGEIKFILKSFKKVVFS